MPAAPEPDDTADRPAASLRVAPRAAGDRGMAAAGSNPAEVTGSDLLAARLVHARFAAGLATALGGHLRAAVDVEVTGVEAGTRATFARFGSPQACRARLTSRQPPGAIDLELDRSFVHPALDLLLGGSGREATIPQRPLTQVERRLLGIVLQCCARSLGEAWSAGAALEFDVDELGDGTRISPPASAAEPLIIVRLEATLLGRTGGIALGIPLATFRPLLTAALPPDLPVELRAVLGRATATAPQLQSLAPGDVLTTSIPAEAAVPLEIDGRPERRGAPVAFRGQKAFRVIDDPDVMQKRSPPRRNKGCD